MAGAAADIAIRGGEVLTGTGAPPVPADLAISSGRIVAITPRLLRQGARP